MRYRKTSGTHYIERKFFCAEKTDSILKVYISGKREEPITSFSYLHTVTSLILRVQPVADLEVITDHTLVGMIYIKQQKKLCFDTLESICAGRTVDYYRVMRSSPLANLISDPTYIKVMQGNSIIKPQEGTVYKVTSAQLYIKALPSG